MFKHGFTLTKVLLVTVILAFAIMFVVEIAEAQEVQPAQVGTISTAPGLSIYPNSGMNIFRPNTFVGAVVTFPRASNVVDWEAMRTQRLAGIGAAVAEDVHFKFDSVVVKDESATVLFDFAQLLIANPDVDVSIEGFADSVGNPAHNLALSFERCESVRVILMAAGLPADRIQVAAHGSEFSSDDNDLDRRVEFNLIDSFTGATIN